MDNKIIDYVKKSFDEKTVIDNTIHDSIRSLYLQYLIVGGMPEAVNVFFDTHDINAVREVQNNILNSIRDDFGRYKDSKGNDKVNEVLKLRAEACLDSIPAQLSKEYKKFQYSLVNAKGHSQDKADGLRYLIDVGLVVCAYNTREMSFPLEGVRIPSEFKVFYADTGLLISRLGDDVPFQILSGNISAYKGAIAENMIATAFVKNGVDLYYYHAKSGSPEIDFLYENDGEVTMVECKSTNNRATSMKYVIANPKKYGKHPAVKFSDTNIGRGEGFSTYPLYAACFVSEKTNKNIVPSVDVSNLKIPE